MACSEHGHRAPEPEDVRHPEHRPSRSGLCATSNRRHTSGMPAITSAIGWSSRSEDPSTRRAHHPIRHDVELSAGPDGVPVDRGDGTAAATYRARPLTLRAPPAGAPRG